MVRGSRLATAGGLALLALLARSSIPAENCPAVDPTPAPPERVCPAVDRIRTASLRVFLDRRTGRVRAPSPEEARALFESGGRDTEGLELLEIVVHPDGMRSVDLKGAFSSRVVLRRNPDGTLTMRCLPPGSGGEEK